MHMRVQASKKGQPVARLALERQLDEAYWSDMKKRQAMLPVV
jgi:hypothetical protein